MHLSAAARRPGRLVDEMRLPPRSSPRVRVPSEPMTSPENGRTFIALRTATLTTLHVGAVRAMWCASVRRTMIVRLHPSAGRSARRSKLLAAPILRGRVGGREVSIVVVVDVRGGRRRRRRRRRGRSCRRRHQTKWACRPSTAGAAKNSASASPSTSSRRCRSTPPEAAGQAPNGVEFDCGNLDFNGARRRARTRSGPAGAHESEEEIAVEVLRLVDRPPMSAALRRLLYLALDGTPPRAETNQQRGCSVPGGEQPRKGGAGAAGPASRRRGRRRRVRRVGHPLDPARHRVHAQIRRSLR